VLGKESLAHLQGVMSNQGDRAVEFSSSEMSRNDLLDVFTEAIEKARLPERIAEKMAEVMRQAPFAERTASPQVVVQPSRNLAKIRPKDIWDGPDAIMTKEQWSLVYSMVHELIRRKAVDVSKRYQKQPRGVMFEVRASGPSPLPGSSENLNLREPVFAID
jgi:hypothetical protein